jgi:hypothetical protein
MTILDVGSKRRLLVVVDGHDQDVLAVGCLQQRPAFGPPPKQVDCLSVASLGREAAADSGAGNMRVVLEMVPFSPPGIVHARWVVG